MDWNFCNSWKSVKGEISRREGRDMKPVRLAVMQKVEFPNPYIKAGGGGVGFVMLEPLSCFLCVLRVVVSF